MNTTKKTVIAENYILFALTPQTAMELIRNIASSASKGRDFTMSVHTADISFSHDVPTASVTVDGFYDIKLPLVHSQTQGESLQVHFTSEGA